ncbi:hypothetical protein J6590_082059 [Homalodisca vitripennis]|nr:hypothetical protein J6590_085210 [Homalodisca vitripennis]KAG8295343.1 hypothetical protein J6590_082059 [Homalodisca vitripennis]
MEGPSVVGHHQEDLFIHILDSTKTSKPVYKRRNPPEVKKGRVKGPSETHPHHGTDNASRRLCGHHHRAPPPSTPHTPASPDLLSGIAALKEQFAKLQMEKEAILHHSILSDYTPIRRFYQNH